VKKCGEWGGAEWRVGKRGVEWNGERGGVEWNGEWGRVEWIVGRSEVLSEEWSG
jgi:hypothetical protein